MDSIENVYKNLKNHFLSKFHLTSFEENYSIELDKLNSLSNDIYHVIYKRKNDNEIIYEVCYRNFGEIGELVNRELESFIIKSLSDKKLGPKIIDNDISTYRIDEYINDSQPLPHEILKTEKILKKIIKLFLCYNEILPVYKYEIINKNNFQVKYHIFNHNVNNINNNVNNIQNIIELCIKKMLPKGLKALENFKVNLKNKNDLTVNKKFENIYNFANNLKQIFFSNFPEKFFFILNHNDTLRENLLLKEDEILIIDHEYGSLNLPGFDIVNYLVESNFDYSREINFIPEEIDLNFYYEIFLKYINELEKNDNICEFKRTNEGMNFFNEIKTMNYFLRLTILDNILWFIFALIYFNYEKFIKKIGFNYFQHAYDRTIYYEKILEFKKNLNN